MNAGAAQGKRLIVEIRSGPLAGRKTVVEPGGALRVGRTDAAALVVPQDRQMSGEHFALAWDGAKCSLRDLGSAAGTQVDGIPAVEADVRHGAWIRAGETSFLVWFEEGTVRPAIEDPPEIAARKAAAREALRVERGPIFALLDAARTPRVLELLRESVEVYASLYEGLQAEALADVAPYLVALPAGAPLLDALVREGWGQSWGVYLACARPFADVRRHFRRLVFVEDPRGKRLYFRFYDPRVLRAFLPTCSTRQSAEMFGEIRCFLLEGRAGEVLRYAPV